MIKSIHEVPPEFLVGERILIRVDFNVPLTSGGSIVDFSRIDASMKTIAYLKNSGARIILMSHLGRESHESLLPVFNYLKTKIDLTFIPDWEETKIINEVEKMKDGQIVLLQNLRAKKEEEENDPVFAKFLASLGDIYVNDAFSVSHREHASVVGVPKILKSYCGCQFKNEIDSISKVFNPEHPFVVLMGGAKFETKIPVIESLLGKADSIFVGGALANDILKANGYEVGQSKVNDIDKTYAEHIFNNEQIILVEDVRVQSFLFNKNKTLKEVTVEDRIIDGGFETANVLTQKIKEAKLIIWNGPFGTFEQGNSFLSKKVAEAIAASEAYSIIGGGDTVAEVKKLRKEKVFDFVSLAGGAMLEFVARGSLVGVDVLDWDK